MFSSPPRDCIPADRGWQPAALDMSKTQKKKRAMTNAKASEIEASWSAGVLKDRHPGWKFHTTFEPDVWRVEKVEGTMMTTVIGGRRVTRNVLWLQKVVQNNGVRYSRDPEEAHSPDLRPSRLFPLKKGYGPKCIGIFKHVYMGLTSQSEDM
ncbi:hypothetical protein NDU88_001280 [Pleurodeles waltl]|uniref:Uncharacterized protein n=1 Tax=Pleurodeles waltl TaxID=8319 RepID=A0AAV7VYY5_PLEWA|nr:hypothetical protein NDU88_001280 [Pleurodeles waltl]